ncbi:MAG: preprotein translocase subunit SecG [Ginsengibacter sp.]
MLYLFVILIILASVILGVIILIQNPKGGGLNSALGGFGNQLMGVRQTTDVLEKGTWVVASIIGILCITSALFIPAQSGGVNSRDRLIQEAPVGTPVAPQNTTPFAAPQTAPTPAPAPAPAPQQ